MSKLPEDVAKDWEEGDEKDAAKAWKDGYVVHDATSDCKISGCTFLRTRAAKPAESGDPDFKMRDNITVYSICCKKCGHVAEGTNRELVEYWFARHDCNRTRQASSSPLTPFALRLLLDCYISRRSDLPESDVKRDITADFFKRDLLVTDAEGALIVTPKGRAFIKSILATPEPRVAYLDVSGEEIEP